jgi:hypothetical protein
MLLSGAVWIWGFLIFLVPKPGFAGRRPREVHLKLFLQSCLLRLVFSSLSFLNSLVLLTYAYVHTRRNYFMYFNMVRSHICLRDIHIGRPDNKTYMTHPSTPYYGDNMFF